MNRRMAAALASLATIGALAVPAQAALAAPHGHGHGGQGAASHAPTATAVTPQPSTSAEAQPARPAHPAHPVKAGHGADHRHQKAVHFTAVGVVKAVDASAGTLTVHVVAAHKGQRGTDISVAVVASTKIVRGRSRATLADIQVGARVTVVGFHTADGFVATHVAAGAAPLTTPTSSDSPAPSGTDSPAPSSSDSPAPTDSAPAPTTTPSDPTPTVTPSA